MTDDEIVAVAAHLLLTGWHPETVVAFLQDQQ